MVGGVAEMVSSVVSLSHWSWEVLSSALETKSFLWGCVLGLVFLMKVWSDICVLGFELCDCLGDVVLDFVFRSRVRDAP